MYGLDTGGSLFSYEESSLSTLRRAIDAYVNEKSRNSVRLKSVVVHAHLIDVIQSVSHRFNDASITTTDQGDHFQVELERKIRRSDIEGGERMVSGSFACFQHEDTDVWTAITGHDPDFFERGIEWLVQKAAPEVSEFYATSTDLQAVLSSLDDSMAHDSQILATEVVPYTHNGEGNINYEQRPYPVAFRKAREEDKYIHKVQFTAIDDNELLIDGFLRRDGVTQLNRGNADYFINDFLRFFVREGQEKADLFGDKERSRETGDVQQIELAFDEHVFRKTEDNKKLINALSEIKKTNITVYHKNPYAHISVLDIIDGSSADVFITDSDKISIVPSYRSSLNSLMRLSDKISKEFDESSIDINDSPDYSCADFFAG